MVPQELERVSLLIGEENVEKLQKATVLVVGVGGVGSYAAEALARSGVGHLILLDKDVVDITNLNRQIMASHDTIGISKTEAMKQRILSFAKDCEVECIDCFFDSTKADYLENVDFVVDAIDTVSSKIDLMEACAKRDVPLISSLGMGNRLDSSCVKVCDLWETEGDPLARSVRQLARKKGLTKPIPVLVSSEIPHKQSQTVNEEGTTRKDRIPPASMVFVPAAAGLLAASYVVRNLIGEVTYEK